MRTRTSRREHRSSMRARSRPASGVHSTCHASTASSATRLAIGAGTASASAASRTKARTSSPCSGSSTSRSSENRATGDDGMYGPVCVRCGRRRARAGGNSVKRRFLSAVLGFHGCGLGWFSLAAFDDKLWPHLRIGRLKKQESETGSCQEPSRSSVLVRKRKVRTANAHRRQHGQHHASHRSDRRAYCSRWRLVRPGSLVLDPALRAPRLAKGWRRAPMRSNRVVEHGLADRLLQHELARRSHQEIRRSRCSGSPAALRVPRYWRRRPTS